MLNQLEPNEKIKFLSKDSDQALPPGQPPIDFNPKKDEGMKKDDDSSEDSGLYDDPDAERVFTEEEVIDEPITVKYFF